MFFLLSIFTTSIISKSSATTICITLPVRNVVFFFFTMFDTYSNSLKHYNLMQKTYLKKTVQILNTENTKRLKKMLRWSEVYTMLQHFSYLKSISSETFPYVWKKLSLKQTLNARLKKTKWKKIEKNFPISIKERKTCLQHCN